jgi:peroxiredoxin
MKTSLQLIAPLFALLLVAGASPNAQYEVGDTVTDFTLKNVDEQMISLSDYQRSKGVILIFDSNTCPYSKAYNDRIISLNKKYAPMGFPVVTINSNDPEQSAGDSFEAMVSRAKNKNYDFPYLQDDAQEVARTFGATNTPHVFLLQREEQGFVVRYIGAIDNHSRNAAQADKKYVEEAVNALLQEKPVPVKKTKAVGCGIRWKDA